VATPYAYANRGLEKEIQKGVEMLTVDIEKTPFFQIGEKIGIQKGKIEGIIETAIQMIKEFNLPIDEVVKKLNIKKDELLEYMTREK